MELYCDGAVVLPIKQLTLSYEMMINVKYESDKCSSTLFILLRNPMKRPKLIIMMLLCL